MTSAKALQRMKELYDSVKELKGQYPRGVYELVLEAMPLMQRCHISIAEEFLKERGVGDIMISFQEALLELQDSIKGGGYQCRAEVYEKALEALEMQIPKTPLYEGEECADGKMVYGTWRCPYCEMDYEVEHEIYDFCPNCGQAINWEENK